MLTAVVVFPTPPFWLAIARTTPISFASSVLVRDRANRCLRSFASERALSRHSQPARQPLRRGAILTKQVDVSIAAGRIRLDRPHLRRFHRQPLGRAHRGRLLLRIAGSLPGE